MKIGRNKFSSFSVYIQLNYLVREGQQEKEVSQHYLGNSDHQSPDYIYMYHLSLESFLTLPVRALIMLTDIIMVTVTNKATSSRIGQSLALSSAYK